MAVLEAIVAGVGAVVDIAEGVQKIGTMLDGQRSVVLVVENDTRHALERVETYHDHGGFKVTPSGRIEPRTVEIFGAQDKGFMTGVEGGARYRILDGRDDEESFAWLTWNNPFVGSNKIGAMAYYDGPPLPPPSTDHLPFPSAYYVVAAVCGAGDKDAEMRYTIKRR